MNPLVMNANNMMDTVDKPCKPLVSFVVIAYKQEQFIREAIQSAFAQTYEPLEIILSDDCSPDCTFEIMKEEVAQYCGAHTVTLNRNPINMGMAGNVNQALAMCTGEFIVVLGGDDIAFSNRTEVMANAWLESGRADLLCSNVVVIDENGEVLQDRWDKPLIYPLHLAAVFRSEFCGAVGCACAFSRRIYEKYGPLADQVIQEDNVIPFWALLEDGVYVVDEPLVYYRVHNNNVYVNMNRKSKKSISRIEAKKWAVNSLVIAEEWLRSWDISGHTDLAARKKLVLIREQRRLDVQGYSTTRWQACLLILSALKKRLPMRKVGGLVKRHILRLA